MKQEIIKPGKARAVGVITPPLSEMLELEEDNPEFKNQFYDVRTIRTNGADKTYKGATRKTQNLGKALLDVDIVVDTVTFYAETPEQGWFGLSVYVAGTETRVNRGHLKIYVRDVDGVITSDVLIKEYEITDSQSLGWQIDHLNWSDVIQAFRDLNRSPYHCFNVKVVYTDTSGFYANKTVYPPRRICYSTHPQLLIKSEVCLDDENKILESYDVQSNWGINRVHTLTSSQCWVDIYGELNDGLDYRMGDVPITVTVQDTQEEHTIDGVHYNKSADIPLGNMININGSISGASWGAFIETGEVPSSDTTQDEVIKSNHWTIEVDTMDTAGGCFRYMWKIPPGFLDTTESRPRRHIFVTLFVPKSTEFTGGDGIRSTSGFECRLRLDYLQPVQFTSFTDNSDYATRSFDYHFNIVDRHGNDVPCKVIAKVNGVTIVDATGTKAKTWERTIEQYTDNHFDVSFDLPYLHAGDNLVELKLVTDYDYQTSEYSSIVELPKLHYMISQPTLISGAWEGTGPIEIEYIVGTIENGELPNCDVWDLKINDETLVAQDKAIIDGEWNGQYTEIIGTLASSFTNTSYNSSTGALRIKFDHYELPVGRHNLKLVLPETDAINAGSSTSSVYIQDTQGGGQVSDPTIRNVEILDFHMYPDNPTMSIIRFKVTDYQNEPITSITATLKRGNVTQRDAKGAAVTIKSSHHIGDGVFEVTGINWSTTGSGGIPAVGTQTTYTLKLVASSSYVTVDTEIPYTIESYN